MRLDPPAARAGWLKLILRVLRRRDAADAGVYREMIAEIERLLAAAERERSAR